MKRLAAIVLTVVLAACSGGGEGSTTVTTGLAGGGPVELPPVKPRVVEGSLDAVGENAAELSAVEAAGAVLVGEEGDEAERCSVALGALSPVTPDELLEIAAAVPDEVLASAYLGERAALIRLMEACAAGTTLPEEELERLAAVLELITLRVAALEAAG